MGLRATWGFQKKLKPSTIGTDIPSLKIQSLKSFFGLAVTHVQVKAYENGNLPCQCENLQQEAKEQFVILW